jgi:chorismate mutase / prephenate dehydrogenase
MLRLIRSSLQVQEQDSIAAAGGGAGQRALVIGGAGRMGLWMVRFLDSQGYRVDVLDPAGPLEGHLSHSDLDEVALDHDVIVVAAPLRISNDILLQLAARRPPPRGLVFDIGSLKTPLRPGLEACRHAGIAITSIHPMFGPDTELLTGRHVIFVDVGDAAARGSARQLFASTMATPIDMDVDRHDRLIAYVLGLSHALNIAFFSVLAECGEAAGELTQLSSTTFDAQLAIAAAVASESPGLYFEIQSLNAYGAHSLEALEAMVARVRTIVEAGDEAAFSALMVHGRAYLQERGPSR